MKSPSCYEALESLMPEPHSKLIHWYRCSALCSTLLGMAMGTTDFGDWLANDIASNGPTLITFSAIVKWLFVLQRNSSGTWLPHHSFWECALSRNRPFYLRQDMLCQGVTVWTKNHNDSRVLCLQDTHEFPLLTRSLKDKEPHRSRKIMSAQLVLLHF
jgi:hypothetical protein